MSIGSRFDLVQESNVALGRAAAAPILSHSQRLCIKSTYTAPYTYRQQDTSSPKTKYHFSPPKVSTHAEALRVDTGRQLAFLLYYDFLQTADCPISTSSVGACGGVQFLAVVCNRNQRNGRNRPERAAGLGLCAGACRSGPSHPQAACHSPRRSSSWVALPEEPPAPHVCGDLMSRLTSPSSSVAHTYPLQTVDFHITSAPSSRCADRGVPLLVTRPAQLRLR